MTLIFARTRLPLPNPTRFQHSRRVVFLLPLVGTPHPPHMVMHIQAPCHCLLQYSFGVSFGTTGWVGAEGLTLAFEEEAMAKEWHEQISSLADSVVATNEGIVRSTSRFSEASSKPDADEVDSMDGLSHSGRPGSGGAAEGASPQGEQPSQQSASSQQRQRRRAWSSVQHMNGVAVYAEESGVVDEGEEEGGALMASTVVTGSPKACFNEIMRTHQRSRAATAAEAVTGATHGLGFGDAVLLERLDSHTDVVLQTMQPAGLLGSLCAPRTMVLLRTWRLDLDGTYIVLYQSTTHRLAPPEKWGWPWSRVPVRAHVSVCLFACVCVFLPSSLPSFLA